MGYSIVGIIVLLLAVTFLSIGIIEYKLHNLLQATSSASQTQLLLPFSQSIHFISAASIMIILFMGILILLMVLYLLQQIRKTISEPLTAITENVLQIEETGRLASYIGNQSDDNSDEIGLFGQALHSLLSETQTAIEQINSAMSHMANGDLSHRIHANLKGDLEAMKDSTNLSIDHLCSLITNIKLSVSDMASAVIESTKHVEEASKKAQESTATVIEGQRLIDELKLVIEKISESGKRIKSISHVILGIADKTNIISLNASVEAARAGAAGTSFSVVANEVRSLALHSSTSANEIHKLIEESSISILAGVVTSEIVHEKMNTVVDSVKRTDEMLTQISERMDKQNEVLASIRDEVEKFQI